MTDGKALSARAILDRLKGVLERTLETAEEIVTNLEQLDAYGDQELRVSLQSTEQNGTYLDVARWVLPVVEVAAGVPNPAYPEVCECLTLRSREQVAWLIVQLQSALPYMLPDEEGQVFRRARNYFEDDEVMRSGMRELAAELVRLELAPKFADRVFIEPHRRGDPLPSTETEEGARLT